MSTNYYWLAKVPAGSNRGDHLGVLTDNGLFIWDVAPVVVTDVLAMACWEHEACVVDEYGRQYTGDEFDQFLANLGDDTKTGPAKLGHDFSRIGRGCC